MSRFYVAAITGRSGSGKSYASEYLANAGVPVIDGDVVARQVVQKGSRCLQELTKAFGKEILQEDGSLNRQLLAEICFSNPDDRDRLNRITHPHIIKVITKEFDNLREQGKGYCVVEAAALVESGLYSICDKVIMITSLEQLQIQRIMKRDSITEQQARTRLSSQLASDEVKNICDMIISNNGTLEEFNSKLDMLAKQLDTWFSDTK